ncbi:reverse transcriptase domain-containing protein [Tanacetum coccineum]
MISKKSHNPRKRPVEGDYSVVGEITFPPLPNTSLADPIIIKAYMSGRQVNRVYLDSGSSYEVIYEHCFLKLKPSIRSLRVDSKIPLVGFSGEQSWSLREVPLEIMIGKGPLTVTKTLNFVIVRSEEKQKITSEEYQEDTKDILSYMDAEERIVVSDQYPEQTIVIGIQLPTKIKIKLQDLLRAYTDVFAWTTVHMTGVPMTIIIGGEAFNTEHRINKLKHLDPVKQKKRSLAPERNEAIHIQMHTKDITKSQWLKETKKKQPSTQKKGCFCYKRLPFGLKSTGATYHNLIDKVFNNQLGRNMEVYADDIVIKSDSEEEMLADIKETVERLRVINLKLNQKKCSFGVEEEIFSGHLITK